MFRRARPAPRRSIRSREKSTQNRSTSAFAITPGTSPTLPPISPASRSRCWSRTADSVRRPRRRSRVPCSITTFSGRSRACLRCPAPDRASRKTKATSAHGKILRAAGQDLGSARAPRGQLPHGGSTGDRRHRAHHAVFRVGPEYFARYEPGYVAGICVVADVDSGEHSAATIGAGGSAAVYLGCAAADRGGAWRNRGQWIAPLAQFRLCPLSAFRADEDRAPADACLVFSEARNARSLPRFHPRGGAHRRAGLADQTRARSGYRADDRRFRVLRALPCGSVVEDHARPPGRGRRGSAAGLAATARLPAGTNTDLPRPGARA